MREVLRLEVYGLPVAQGSKRHVGNGIMVESAKNHKPWRDSVTCAARESMAWAEEKMVEGPVALAVNFQFTRPRSHYGKNGLRASAPMEKTTKPDLSKLLRSVEDSLTDAGVYRDDAQVVSVNMTKHFGDYNAARIRVTEL